MQTIQLLNKKKVSSLKESINSLKDWQLSHWFKTGEIPIVKEGEKPPYAEVYEDDVIDIYNDQPDWYHRDNEGKS